MTHSFMISLMPNCASFLQHVSIACYAEHCISYDRFHLSVRLSVRHSPVSCQNYSMIMWSSLEDSPQTR